MSARFEIRDRVSIVWVTGSVKASTASNLHDVIMSAIDGSPSGSRVVVDLRDVRALSENAAQALVNAKDAATVRNMSFSTNVVPASAVHTTLTNANVISAVHTILVPPRDHTQRYPQRREVDTMATPEVQVTSRRIGHTLVLEVNGEIDHRTAPHLRTQVDAALTTAPDLVVFDLSAVRFMSSAGSSYLYALHLSHPGQIRVAAGNSAIFRPIELIGLSTTLPVFPTIDAALSDRVSSEEG